MKREIEDTARVLNNDSLELADRNFKLYALWGKVAHQEELLAKILADLRTYGDSIVTKLTPAGYEHLLPGLEKLKHTVDSLDFTYETISEILSLKSSGRNATGFIPADIAIVADDSVNCRKTAMETKMTLKHFLNRDIPVYGNQADIDQPCDFTINIMGTGKRPNGAESTEPEGILLTIPSSAAYSFHNIEGFLDLKKAGFNIDNGYGAAIHVLKVLNSNALATGNVLVATAGLADDLLMQDAVEKLKEDETINTIFCLKDIGINTIDNTMSSLVNIQHLMRETYPDLIEGDFGFDSTLVFAGLDGVFSVLITSKVNGGVISIPSGVGYGTNDTGLVTYLSMVNGCGAGTVTVSPADIDTACDLARKTVALRSKNQNRQAQKAGTDKVMIIG